jgi:hypothetical protein
MSAPTQSLSRGAWLGGAAGFVLSVAYTLWLVAYFVVSTTISYQASHSINLLEPDGSLLNLLNFIGVQLGIAVFCMGPFAIILGIVPGVVIGSVTGSMIQWVVTRSGWVSHELQAILFSLLTSTVGISPCVFMLNLTMTFPTLFTFVERLSARRIGLMDNIVFQVLYVFAFLGSVMWTRLPMLVLLLASAWLGRKLYREHQASLSQ